MNGENINHPYTFKWFEKKASMIGQEKVKGHSEIV